MAGPKAKQAPLKVANSTPTDRKDGVPVTTTLAPLIAYVVNTRAFHPNKNFEGWGFRFHGDNRGFSMDDSWFDGAPRKPTSRIWQTYTIDMNLDTTIALVEGTLLRTESNHSGPGPGLWRLLSVNGEDYKENRYKPRGKITFGGVNAPHGGQKIADARAHFGGENHAFLLSNTQQIFLGKAIVPTLDVFHETWIRVERVSKYADIVSFCYGDGFPNAEGFIADPSGKKLFLGSHIRIGYPATHLWFERNRIIWGTSLRVELDKDGNFGDKVWVFAQVQGGPPAHSEDYPTTSKDEKCVKGSKPRYTTGLNIASKERGIFVWDYGDPASLQKQQPGKLAPLFVSAFAPLDVVRGNVHATLKNPPVLKTNLATWNSLHINKDPNSGRDPGDPDYLVSEEEWNKTVNR